MQTEIIVRSTVARLLATENIEVIQSNSKTAWFDVDKRVLNLPLWDVSDYVYDMLVGHEVGHALFTPASGWHDSIVDLGIPRSYINVVEDARIEKLVKRKYPGIVYTFTKAYAWMNEEDFFKISGKEVNALNLIDRINLYFKLGVSCGVKFNSDEHDLVQMVSECETFEDVVAACEAIIAYNKERDIASEDNAETDGHGEYAPSDEDTDAGESIDVDLIPSDSGNADADIESGNIDNQSEDDAGTSNTDPESADDEKSDNGSGSNVEQSANDKDNSESFTDIALRRNESNMLSKDSSTVVSFFDEETAKMCIVDYKKYHSATRELMFRTTTVEDGKLESEFKKFLSETNKVVSYLAKEFEQRKASYQYSRAKVSNSGALNMSSLHKYKFTEDIFKKVTTLADAKSHGIVISIDFSASMDCVIYDTMRQALNLAAFCRRVSIPFEMYSYTGRRSTDRVIQEKNSHKTGQIDGSRLATNQLMSYKMNKREYDTAFKSLYYLAHGYCNMYDDMQSTPTNEHLNVLKYVLADMRKSTNVQKLINIVLTDGMPNRSFVYNAPYSGKFLLRYNNTKFVKFSGLGGGLSEAILNYFKEEMNVVNVGYFLGNNSILKKMISHISVKADISEGVVQDINSQLRKHGFAINNNILGYDKYIMLKSKSLEIDDSEFTIVDGATKSAIAKGFSQYTKQRRSSRILLDQFVQAVV